MEKSISRRSAIKTMALGALGSVILPETGCRKYTDYISPEATKIRLLFSYGQSNSVGAGSAGDPVTTQQIYDSLMFNGGPIPNPADREELSRLIPLIEGGKDFSETPLSGCAETII